jgi:diguanylate cyclase (GGDEF)-like protein
MGRFINRTVLNQLERYNPVQVSLYVPTRTEKTQRLALDRDNSSGQPLFWIPSQIYTLGSQWISGNIYLVNGRDQISWVLSVVSPRQEYLRGEEMLNNLTLVLFLIGIPLSLISSFMLDRSIRYQQLLKRSEHALQEANQELQRLANLDGLTQIANRRCFDRQLAEEWARGLREQQPLSLILFDVDYFKQFNDAYGHQAGDDCLRTIAKRVQQVLRRPADLIARYGGEEFAVILPNTHRDGSFHLAQTILATVQNLSLAHAQSPLGRVTVSLGVATLMPSRGQSVEVLVAQSDRALYLAKQQGRNRMVSAGLQIG